MQSMCDVSRGGGGVSPEKRLGGVSRETSDMTFLMDKIDDANVMAMYSICIGKFHSKSTNPFKASTILDLQSIPWELEGNGTAISYQSNACAPG
jgi:hypothetical protein